MNKSNLVFIIAKDKESYNELEKLIPKESIKSYKKGI